MIKVEHDKELDAKIFTFEADRNREEVIEAITELYKGPPVKYTLWDFTRSESGKYFTSEDAEKIGLHAEKFAHLRPGGFDILVVPGVIQYGIARMYLAYADRFGDQRKFVKHKLFRSKEEAIKFMKQNNLSGGNEQVK